MSVTTADISTTIKKVLDECNALRRDARDTDYLSLVIDELCIKFKKTDRHFDEKKFKADCGLYPNEKN